MKLSLLPDLKHEAPLKTIKGALSLFKRKCVLESRQD